ncbi:MULTISPECIES: MerR family transcriptional regulator [unclassified Nonomuraea]|uniref:MerR family transcriptional regulator n=1 Tax=unclassified Nonomuraea TaxID=2593643 RepID=UPI0035C23067
MEPIPIGEAARLLGMNASALRYYEERGLVVPAGRSRGRRVYGRQELRRLVFLRMLQQLGVPLETAGAVLDAPGEEWRAAVGERIEELDEVIARARAAQWVLGHALECPAEHPARDCDHLVGMLDQLLEGYTFAQLAAEHEPRWTSLGLTE